MPEAAPVTDGAAGGDRRSTAKLAAGARRQVRPGAQQRRRVGGERGSRRLRDQLPVSLYPSITSFTCSAVRLQLNSARLDRRLLFRSSAEAITHDDFEASDF